MSKNKNLHKAKKEKNDEFYTLLSDIEKEMVWYKDFFKDKVVYCNCDDARESNFFKYFSENFELLGLKKLITTGYIPGGHGVVLEYSGDKNGDFIVSDDEISTRDLAGDGDFRSPECIEFLKQADVVVTNPPFSLFREYIAQLMAFGKKFIIVGNGNAVTYKEVFPYIKNNKLWLGASKGIGGKFCFAAPDTYDGKFVSEVNGVKIAQINNACWFTNVDHSKRHDKLDLYKKYNSIDYPKYDNYDAIDSRTDTIPEDYYGVIGVPITFLDKYCPEQFDIIGFFNNYDPTKAGDGQIYGTAVKVSSTTSLFRGPVIDGKATYFRIIIKRKS